MPYAGPLPYPPSEMGIDISKCKFLGRIQLNADQNLWAKFYYRISDESDSSKTSYDLFIEIEPVVSPNSYPYGIYKSTNGINGGTPGNQPSQAIKRSSHSNELYPGPSQWSSPCWAGFTYSDYSKMGTYRVSFNIVSDYLGISIPEEKKIKVLVDFLFQDNSAASSLTIGNGELGVSMPITVTRYNSSYSHSISYEKGETEYEIAARTTATSLTWTPPDDLAELNTSGNDLRVKVYIRTYDSSGKQVGVRYYYTNLKIPERIKPTISLTVTDPSSLANQYGAYIQSKSKARAHFSVTSAYGAGIVLTEMQLGTQWTKESTYDFTLDTSGTVVIICRTKDTRNRESIAQVQINVATYHPPRITSIDRYRCNADGSPNGEGAYARVVFSAEVSPISNKNSAQYKVQVRQNSLGDWTESVLSGLSGNYSPTDASFIFGADPVSGYDVRVGVTDNFTEQFSGIRQIPPAAALLEVDATGTGMAIGQMAKEPGVLRVNLPTFFNHDVTVGGGLTADNIKFGIVESGASKDGVKHYIKFADGTMVQWASAITTQMSISTAFHSIFCSGVKYYDFLVPFVDTNISVMVNASTRYGSTWASVTEVTTSRIRFQMLDFESRVSGISIMLNFIAIGRWLP